MNGTPPCKTNVGVRVIRGRLPGATTFGLFASVKADCRRWPIKTPVSPATTAGSHAPLGVALNKLPSLSITFTQVVSLARSSGGTVDGPIGGALLVDSSAFILTGSPGS